MSTLITRFVRDEDGQDLIEYALIAGLVALAAVAAVTAIGGSLTGIYDSIKTKLLQATPS